MCSVASDAPAPPRRRGNPTLHLVPRCGARTRSGASCRAPAIHGKQRCRMHGGRSTGARTPEGHARLAALHTTHGFFTPQGLAQRSFSRSLLGRARVALTVDTLLAQMPAPLAERFRQGAREFLPPPLPREGISSEQNGAIIAADAAALAPWREAIAAIREGRRQARLIAWAARPSRPSTLEALLQQLAAATPHAPIQAAAAPLAGGLSERATTATPHAPIQSPAAPAASEPSATVTPHAPIPPAAAPAAPDRAETAATATPHAPIPRAAASPGAGIRASLLAGSHATTRAMTGAWVGWDLAAKMAAAQGRSRSGAVSAPRRDGR